ncbi:DUF4349 domain-containing protein [uncultured Methanoregula sp.]|uniref:DUF4349 domain-containing protein n=1 Tax=uncultured Methanoregula sp. TaxID=1005933 RepID=UPI002AABCA09|nr:DUF4349 domain-containing protein [uncultured Methanoregula sp.]
MKYKVIALLALVIIAIAATGCMGLPATSTSQSASVKEVVYSSESYGKTSSDARVAMVAGNAAPVAAPTHALTQSGSGSAGVETKIIKTAYLSLEVKDVTGAVESLKGIAAAEGGYISSTNVQKNYNNLLTGTVILRIPQAAFENTLTGVKALGTIKSASTQGEDVTEEYVDLQAQRTSYQNQLAQYNAIMKQSTKVEDIIKVQEQIDRVQTELNRLDGKLKYLNSRVDYSTITVNLQEPEPVGGESGHSFISTINEGIAGFFGMIDTIIVLIFTLLPLIIVAVAGYGVYRWHKGKKPVKEINEIKEK